MRVPLVPLFGLLVLIGGNSQLLASSELVDPLPIETRVDERGSATSYLPIKIPKGFNGVEPRLGISFNSRAGRSHLGKGFSLAGLSSIDRCPPAFEEGINDPIDFDSNDRFCLDGQQLVLTQGEYGVTGSQYRLKFGDRKKVEAFTSNGNFFFKVYDGSGNTSLYGSKASSRVTGDQGTLSWAIDKVYDSYGNYVLYEYSQDNSKERLIKTIKYTGFDPSLIGSNASVASEELPLFRVDFVYQERNRRVFFAAGISQSEGSLLKSIEVRYDNKIEWTYSMSYVDSNGFHGHLLDQVLVCSAEKECYKPLRFRWQEPQLLKQFERQSRIDTSFGLLPDDGSEEQILKLVDMNNDGYADQVKISDFGVEIALNDTEGSFLPSRRELSDFRLDSSSWSLDDSIIQIQDIDRNGYPDLIGFTYNGVIVSLGTKEGLQPASTWTKSFSLQDGWRKSSSFRTLVDLNKDGKLDILAISRGDIWVSYQNDGAFSEEILVGEDFGGSYNWNERSDVFPVDINLDGLPDIVGRKGRELYVAENSNQGFLPATRDRPEILRFFSDSNDIFSFADFNGDQIFDIAVIDNYDVRIAFGNGVGFEEAQTWTESFSKGWDKEKHFRTIVDINRDGLPDLVGSKGRELEVSINTGSSYAEPITISHSSNRWNTQSAELFFEDLNGDGKIDLSAYDRDGLYFAAGRYHAPKLVTISDSHGQAVELFYGTLNDSQVYTRGSNADYPTFDYAGSLDVVKAMEVLDGAGGRKRVSYQYESLVMHQFWGSLGFAKVIKHDEKLGTIRVSHYSQNWEQDLQGQPLRIETFLPAKAEADTPVLSGLTEYTYETSSYDNGKRRVVRLKSLSSEQFDREKQWISSQTKEFTYDKYGNTLSVSTNQSDPFGTHTKLESSTYYIDESRWIVRKPLSKSETFDHFDKRLGIDLPTRILGKKFEYDASGRLMATVSNPKHDREERAELTYSARGMVINTSKTWPRWIKEDGLSFSSISESMSYDDYGYPERVENALGHATSYVYDPVVGKALKETDPNGLTTFYRYDSFGRLQQRTSPDGVIWSSNKVFCDSQEATVCPDNGFYFVEEKQSGQADRYTFYDAFGRPIRNVTTAYSGVPVYVDTQYNEYGLVSKRSNPYFAGSSQSDIFWTEHVYDIDLMLEEKILPDGSKLLFEREGLATTITNAKGFTKRTTRNSRNQVIESRNNDEPQSAFYYDARGKLWLSKDVAGNETTVEFDDLGYKIALDSPDRGLTSFSYNRMGLVDGKLLENGWKTQTVYDALGRAIEISSIDTNGLASASEVRRFVFDTATNGIGMLAKSSLDGGDYEESFEYDSLSRLSKKITTVAGTPFIQQFTYDRYSRLDSHTYPTGFGIKNSYNEWGYQTQISNLNQDGSIYWGADDYDARGQLLQATLGNGVVESYEYDPALPRMLGTEARKETKTLQSLGFLWDNIGNLGQRTDRLRNVQEVFSYDSLNRLVSYDRGNGQVDSLSYDENGNILFKTDMGQYSYGEACTGGRAGPHAVSSVVGKSKRKYCYDLAGYMTAGDDRIFKYSPIGKPTRIQQGQKEILLKYDSHESRYYREDTIQNVKTETVYVDSYERVRSNGLTKHKHYIDGVGIVEWQGDKKTTTYFHRDHLGSVTAHSDEEGNRIASFSYDPWGKRRSADNFEALELDVFQSVSLDGFTGHEHLESVGLVHMNGRVYDPALARFTSADPYVQDPYHSQSHNRYSYVWNNPLNSTDPSGYISIGSVSRGFKDVGDAIGNFVKQPGKELVRLATVNYLGNNRAVRNTADKAGRWIKRNERTLVAISVTAIAMTVPVAGVAIGQTFWGSVALGAVNGYITSGGDLRATAIGAVSAGVFYGIGSAFAVEPGMGLTAGQKMGKVLAHGVAGGARSVALGGTFEDGFRSAAISQSFAVSGAYDNLPQDTLSQGLGAAAVGGVSAELTGGSFEDSAITAFYSHTFNDMAHAIEFAGQVFAMGAVPAFAEPTPFGEAGLIVAMGAAAAAGWLAGDYIQSNWLNESAEGANTRKPSSTGKMQQEVNKKQAPKSVDRVDKGRGPYEKDHVHFNDKNKSALNNDGSWKHGGKKLNTREKEWINKHNWTLP